MPLDFRGLTPRPFRNHYDWTSIRILAPLTVSSDYSGSISDYLPCQTKYLCLGNGRLSLQLLKKPNVTVGLNLIPHNPRFNRSAFDRASDRAIKYPVAPYVSEVSPEPCYPKSADRPLICYKLNPLSDNTP